MIYRLNRTGKPVPVPFWQLSLGVLGVPVMIGLLITLVLHIAADHALLHQIPTATTQALKGVDEKLKVLNDLDNKVSTAQKRVDEVESKFEGLARQIEEVDARDVKNTAELRELIAK